MSARPPLVLNAGRVQQLQSSDYLSGSFPELQTFTNDNAGTIVIGSPVYVKSNGHVDLAKANASGTTRVCGLVFDAAGIATTVAGNVIIDGTMTATTGQWDAVAGTSGGLTPGTIYYLSAATPGVLTSTAPSAATQFVMAVGIALSSTQMELLISEQIISL